MEKQLHYLYAERSVLTQIQSSYLKLSDLDSKFRDEDKDLFDYFPHRGKRYHVVKSRLRELEDAILYTNQIIIEIHKNYQINSHEYEENKRIQFDHNNLSDKENRLADDCLNDLNDYLDVVNESEKFEEFLKFFYKLCDERFKFNNNGKK
jgi:hypothetical protein